MLPLSLGRLGVAAALASAFAAAAVDARAIKFKAATNTTGNVGRNLNPDLSSSSQNIALTCTETATVTAGDSCTDIVNSSGLTITLEEFIALNKQFDADFDCASLTADEVVCLSDDETTSDATTTSSAATATATSDSSSSSSSGSGSSDGSSSNSTTTTGCVTYYTSLAGENCTSLAANFHCNVAFTASANQLYQFQRANPSVNCLVVPVATGTQICVDYNFATSSASSYTPTPVSSCTETTTLTSNSTCASISAAYGITQSDLYTMNTYMTCVNLGGYAGSAICVSIPGISHSSSKTTSKTSATGGSSSTGDSGSGDQTTSDEPTSDPTTTTSEEPQATNSSPCKSCGLSYSSGSDYTNAHNYFRSLYGESSFYQDSSLESDANYAVNYYNGGTRGCGTIDHDSSAGNAGEGENLYWTGSTDSSMWSSASINDAINDWMSEDAEYFSWSNGGSDPANAWSYAVAVGSEV
ncbi:hypothetical protein HK405_013750, partial [Cladochytrium tenue]